MDDFQLSTMALYFAGAIVFSIAAFFALGCFIDVQRHTQRWILSLIFPIILAAMAVSSLLVNRDVTDADLELAPAVGLESPLLVWALRLATGMILALCVARLLSVSQLNEFRLREGKSLYFAFLFLFLTNAVLNNLFGAYPFFDQRALYPLLIFTTLYFSRNKDKNTVIDATKIAMLLFFAGCCATAVLLPQVALQQNYQGWLPWLTVRLWGLGSGPNSIGPLAIVFLLLLAHRPFGYRLLQWSAFAVGLAVLVLSQSKTAWFAAMLCFPLLWWGELQHSTNGRVRALRKLAGPLLICALGLLAVAAALFYNLNSHNMKVLNSEEFTTLTGRTYIWQVALDTWARYPVFGYGSSMWNDQFRQLIDMPFAYHAHNQFLQSMAIAGTVGAVGLVFYVLVLFRYSLAANRETRGLSLALFAMILIRSFTEAPFDLSEIFNGEFVMHLLLFRIVLLKSRQLYAVPAYATATTTASAPVGMAWRKA